MDAYQAERAKLLIAFGAKLRALREPKFATQEELGFAAKMHRTHIGFLEQGPARAVVVDAADLGKDA
jgi:hypothetical protein